jgi:hypothetical protein
LSQPFKPSPSEQTIDLDRIRRLALLLVGACVIVGAANAQTPVSRVRGDIASVNGNAIQLKADNGQTVAVRLAERYSVSARSHADLSNIIPGAFVGTTATAGPDGTLTAVEIHVFPESMRGTGEGHRPMDAATGSTMTNATVASVAASQPAGASRTMTNATVAAIAGADEERRMTLRYKGGEKVVAIPKGTPIVMVETGDPSMLVPGAHVIVTGVQQGDGSLLADRITVGKNGLVPPM